MKFLSTILILPSLYVITHTVYHLILVAYSLIKSAGPAPDVEPSSRFCILIPAHDEEDCLPRLIDSLNSLQYPDDLYEVVVIADNCTDSTASIARLQELTVLERSDFKRRGKGHVIQWALERIDHSRFDAFVIIDADSAVETGYLSHLNKLILSGARIIQTYNGVLNPDETWLTSLLDVSRTIGNEFIHPAKINLGLSSYLMGNGMCFITEILDIYGWNALTIGEDWEYYIYLISKGERVAFSKEAQIYHQESVTLKNATHQRLRWSSGRFSTALKHGFKLFFAGIKSRDPVMVDGAMPLLLPNLSLGLNLTIFCLLLSLMTDSSGFLTSPLLFLSLIAIQSGMFITGILRTNNKSKKLRAFFFAPAFLLWKFCIDIVSIVMMNRIRWIKTTRRR
jgi:cellulose synthase/poly-beta-1,6-N-acetylglucosamine synthase-like glycosyltransferase